MAVPGVRGWSGLPTALASGRGLRSQRARHLHGYHLTRSHSTTNCQLRKWDTPQSLNTTTSHTSPRASSTSRSAQAAVRLLLLLQALPQGGRTFRPRSSARGLAGMKTAVSVSRASADTATGRTPTLTASAMGVERRPARGRRLWRACSYFWTPVVRAGSKE